MNMMLVLMTDNGYYLPWLLCQFCIICYCLALWYF